ncbi:MAG: hypothetical protein OXF79_24660 [Chloroflexi bacterium]|nr:hypothetical protein [Chloroflexota bacterium]
MTTMSTSGRQEVHETNGTGEIRVARPAAVLAVAKLAIAASVPLAAQPGRDLLAREELLRLDSEQALVKEAANGIVVQEAGDLWLVDAMSSDPAGVASAATTEYKYDDGTPEARYSTSSGARRSGWTAAESPVLPDPEEMLR